MTLEELKERRAQLLENREHYAQLTIRTDGAIDMVDLLIEEAQGKDTDPHGPTRTEEEGLPDNVEALPADADS